MPAEKSTNYLVIPSRFPTLAKIVFALYPGEKLLSLVRYFTSSFQVKVSMSTGSLGRDISMIH